jgi:mono/diheme cytochrome c family protein
MMFRAKHWRTALAVCAALLLAGCAQKMADQPKVKPLAGSDFFADGQGARPLPPDTVFRSDSADDDLLNTGKVNGEDAEVFPFPITKDVLLRGQERFNIFCSVCHDRTGSARGMVVQKGYAEPPVLTSQRLIDSPVGHFFDVITNGFSAADQMPSYAAQIPVRDRWAIVAYLRALQLSQNARLDDVPPEVRPTLEAQP